MSILTRRRFIARGAAFTAAAAAAPYLHAGGQWTGSTALAADNGARAIDAYNAMQEFFYQSSNKLYRENYPYDSGQDQPTGFLWSFEEATKATLFMSGLPDRGSRYEQALQERLTAREVYWDGNAAERAYRSYPITGDRYYDDNCWVGSDLVQHSLMTDGSTSSTALDRAARVFSYIQTGWEPDLPKPGGVRWVDAPWNGDRGTAATAGAAKLAAHLYDMTGRRTASYLDWAIEAYEWIQRYLRRPDNGLYWNAIGADGTVGTDMWIYNQGVVIGAAVLLQRVTGRSQYLTDATRVAETTLAFFGTDPYYSGSHGAYRGRAIFNAIFFRNLLMLDAVSPKPGYTKRMQAYADAVWDNPALHHPQHRFRLNGDVRWSLLDQAGMVQVYALLAWDRGMYAKLA